MGERAGDLGLAVERAARRHPDRQAVCDREEAFTYGQLLEEAGRAAASPPAAGGDASHAVLLPLPHRAGSVVAMIGHLLAGRPCLAVNPAEPRARLEALMRAVEDEPARSGDACALYATSGSSGSPKLVGYAGRATRHRAELYAATIGAGPRDRFSLVSPLWTAASASALFTALLTGASVQVLQPAALTPDALRSEITGGGITVWHSIPSLFRRLAGAGVLDGNDFRVVRLGGEPLLATDVELARRVCREDTLLVTGYSLTEANGAITQKAVALGDAEAGTVADAGRAIPGVELEIAGPDGEPLPAGREGEIVVGGELLSAGYLGREESPEGTRFARRGPNRVLRTGDRGVLGDDGSLEVRGRADRRLKVRGHRIDPSEVEAAALAHGGILDAAVLPFATRGGGGEGTALVAVPSDAANRVADRDLRSHLERLIAPEAMPAVVRIVDELPQTPSGKVDRIRLASLLDGGGARGRVDGGGADAVIGNLVRIWRDALEVDDLGPGDDFFALGGDSLAAVEVCAAVESAYEIPMEPATLLRRRTPYALADHVRDVLGGTPAVPAPVLHLNPAGGEPPLFVVPGAGSDATSLVHFAEAIGPEQPVNVIQLPGADGRSRPLTRMDRIAQHCLAAIRRTGAVPPFRIAGTSFGGLVAYLVARELLDRGRDVGYLGLFDTAAPGARRRHHLIDPLHRFGLEWEPSARRLRADPRAELERLRRLIPRLLVDYRLTLSLLLGRDAAPPIEWRFRYLMAGCFMAARNWDPPPLPVPVHLYRCESQPRYLAGAPFLGWDHHPIDITLRHLHSRHGRHIRPPAVDELAGLVSADLRHSREAQASVPRG